MLRVALSSKIIVYKNAIRHVHLCKFHAGSKQWASSCAVHNFALGTHINAQAFVSFIHLLCKKIHSVCKNLRSLCKKLRSLCKKNALVVQSKQLIHCFWTMKCDRKFAQFWLVLYFFNKSKQRNILAQLFLALFNSRFSSNKLRA